MNLKQNLKKKLGKWTFIERWTYEINKLNLDISNWATTKQMQMNGMQIEYEPVVWYKRVLNTFLTWLPVISGLWLIFQGYWILGILVLVLGNLILSNLIRLISRIRFQIQR